MTKDAGRKPMNHPLAQVNVAHMRGPSDDAVMAEFIAALDEVNSLADRSPGFVRRHQTGAGNALAERVYDDPLVLINLSVWLTVEELKTHVYRTLHGRFLARRAAWFHRMQAAHLALWWVPAGHRPSLEEAKLRPEHRRTRGDSPRAFGFQRTFPPDQPDPGETTLAKDLSSASSA